MNVIFDEYSEQVVPIRYHTWWPNENDGFYLHDPLAVQWRLDYYDSIPPFTEYYYVPSFRLDGKYLMDPGDFATNNQWYAWFRQTIDSLLTVPAKARISITDNYIAPDSDSVHVHFDVVAEEDCDFTMKCHLAVTEWRNRYPIPVGRHYYPFRHFEPDINGYDIAPMVAGDSLHFEWAYEIIDSVYNIEYLYTNIFLQRIGTRKVQQAIREQPGGSSGVEIVDNTRAISLGRNTPNPFSAQTDIRYRVAQAGDIRLSVYTLTGRLVADLVEGYAEQGSYSVPWDGRDRFGREVASGVYYYRLQNSHTSQVGKMILLR